MGIIEVVRTWFNPKYTIGRLLIDGVYFSETIEDPCRGLHDGNTLEEILEAKRRYPNEVAIPYGCYKLTTDVISPRYSKVSWYVENMNGGRVPRLMGVNGFDGILFHAGNTADDSDGCILLGENKAKGQVLNSKATCKRFFDLVNGKEFLVRISRG